MKLNRKDILKRAISKAVTSECRYKIAAVGIDHRGRVIKVVTNKRRFDKHGGSHHAEEVLLHRCPKSLERIIIVRVNNRGDKLMPIHPCQKCLKLASKFDVVIEPYPLTPLTDV